MFRRIAVITLALLRAASADAETPSPATAEPASESLTSTIRPADFDPRDRLAILNLLHAYSHAADGLHTDLFGELFTEEARFTVVPRSADGKSAEPAARQTMGNGRAAIVEALRARHEAFRESGTQRRHFLTNPIVWNQTSTRARVSVYLQLRSSTRGAASQLIGTGRYEGRVEKTDQGWRIAEWTIYSDQALE